MEELALGRLPESHSSDPDLCPIICWKSGLNPGDQEMVFPNSLVKKVNSRTIENESVVRQIQASEKILKVDLKENSYSTLLYPENTLRLAISTRCTSSFSSANTFMLALLMVHLPLGNTFALQFSLAVRGDNRDESKCWLQSSGGKIPVSMTKEMPMWLGLYSHLKCRHGGGCGYAATTFQS